MNILLKNCTYIDYKSLIFSSCHILVNEGEGQGIQLFDLESPVPEKDYDITLDCSGKYVTKSFAIGHHHIYSALARGMHPPKKNPQNFHENLKYIWWTLDKALDEESIRASTLATAIACAKDGNTFVIDHHASPSHITGSLDIIADTLEEVGLQHLLCYEITDRNGKKGAQLGLNESANYLSRKQGLMGLHASFTVEDETLEEALKLAEHYNSGIHIHVAEDPIDQQITAEKFGKTVVQRLNESNALGSSKSILAHCLHLSDQEKNILKNAPVWIVQNMESNLKNKVGLFNSRKLGEKIMLGTDGMHSDMIRSAQYAYFAGLRHDRIDPSIVYQRMRNVHKHLHSNGYKGDGPNNLVVLDYDGPTPLTEANFLGHFIYGFHGGHVQHVISNGRLIVKDHRLTQIDESEAIRFTRQQALRLWDKMV